MNGVVEVRTLSTIAGEINLIKAQTRKIILENSIEIGRRLCEAKELCEHGQWGQWLQDNVDYSQATANNLMRIFREYGEQQLGLFGSSVKSQALGILSVTQAVALLGIPPDERESFVEEHNVQDMSTRELEKAVKERKQALEEKDKAEEELKLAQGREIKLKAEKDQVNGQLITLKGEMEKLQTQLQNAKKAGNPEEEQRLLGLVREREEGLKKADKRIEELEQQLKAKPIEVSATKTETPLEIVQELEMLRQQVSKGNKSESMTKYEVYFQEVKTSFARLLGALNEIQKTDAAEYNRYREATIKLIDKMAEPLTGAIT